MKAAIEKADTLIEALAWIRTFRGKTTVIKLGGSVIDDQSALHHILLDIFFMESVGMRPVVIHGAGKRISAAMKDAGVEPRFVEGRRYTDDLTLKIVERVLAEETNHDLVNTFKKIGGNASALNFLSTPVLTGQKLDLQDATGQPVDLGWVGEITDVQCDVIEQLCESGQVPFIPSMCSTTDGQKLNVNADSVATKVAQSLNAEKLVVLSDIPGVLQNREDPESLISSLSAQEAKRLIADGKIEGGMLPKIQGCLDCMEQGVRKVHIIDGRIRHSLLLEIYTSQGIGTVISD